MGESSVQTPPMSPVPLQAVSAPAAPLQVMPAPAAIPTSTQASGAVKGNRLGEGNRRWTEKLVFVCIFLALYAIFKK
jgi:hypothetical protein